MLLSTVRFKRPRAMLRLPLILNGTWGQAEVLVVVRDSFFLIDATKDKHKIFLWLTKASLCTD